MAMNKQDMTRLAINPDWTCNIDDPRNARYLRPLSIAADEDMAQDMASLVWTCWAEKRADDPTFDPDETYRQCLVDARRMLRDREYWALAMGDDQDFSLLQ